MTASLSQEQNVKLQEIVRKVKRLESIGRLISQGGISGEYKSIFRSNGIEFDQVRDYTDSDDSRMIDWNVTARLGQPFVKSFIEERDLNIYFLVDISASGEFSTNIQTKRDIAAEVIATVGINALSRNDRLSLLLYSGTTEKYLPPGKGRKFLWRILREVLYFQPKRRDTSMVEALSFFNKIRHTPGIVFVISDFHDEGYETMIRKTARRNSVILVRVSDEMEREFPSAGIIEFTDSETGEVSLIDTEDLNWQRDYSLPFNKGLPAQSRKIDSLEISTSADVTNILREFFHRKALRR